jgi:hypothetical protein
MNCPHCGASVVPGSSICQSCQTQVVPAPAESATPAPPAQGTTDSLSTKWAVLIVGLALIAMALMLACPANMGSIRPNESATVGRLRTVFNAQMAYASANGGLYDQLPCLVTPHDCIPGYPADGPAFLDGSFLSSAPQNGYDFRQDPGPAPRPETFDPRRSSPSSLVSFVLVAHPVEPGRTGVRHFCMDSTGYLCANRNRIGLLLDKGQCARTCRPVGP